MSISETLKLLFKISRPRFWVYLVGVYLVGYAFAATTYADFARTQFWLHILYFAFPANILLYGINDYFDFDTDQHNPKKQDKETFLKEKGERKILKWSVIISIILSIALLIFEPGIIGKVILTAFIGLSIAYSAPPFRFKARPIIDFTSNVLYIIPGVLAVFHITGEFPPLLSMIALAFWTSAMHLYSAIPDIAADAKVNITTTAVLFGYKKSLMLCTIFWTIFAALIAIDNQQLTPWIYAACIYPLIPLAMLLTPKSDINKIYWLFPFINSIIGAIAFFILVLRLS